VPLQASRADRLHAVAVSTTPGPHNRRSNARVHQMFQATISAVEILWIHPVELDGFVREPALIREPRFEKPLLGIGSTNDLHHVEALGLPIGGQFLKTLPGHSLAQILPPRVAQPEERCAVRVLEMPVI
jgi:hypothetical protein